MLDSLETNSSPVDSKPTRLPPIRILDILVLTTTMAFVFMFQEEMNRMQPFLGAINPVFDYCSRMIYAVSTGVSLAAVYWLINQKRVTGRFFQQPGHWLLGGAMLLQFGLLAVWWVFMRNEGFRDGGSSEVLFGFLAAIQIVAFVLLSFGVFYNSGIWRWVLVSASAVCVFTALSYIGNVFMFQSTGAFDSRLMYVINAMQGVLAITYVVGVLLLIVAMIHDHRKKVSRDWLHWAGVLVTVFHLLIIPILSWFMIRLIQSQANAI